MDARDLTPERITIRLPRWQVEVLDARAAVTGQTRAAYIRQRLALWSE